MGLATKGSHHGTVNCIRKKPTITFTNLDGLVLNKIKFRTVIINIFRNAMQHTKPTRFSSLTKELSPKDALAALRGHLKSQKLQGHLVKIECCPSPSKQQRGQIRKERPHTHLSLIHHNKAIEKCFQWLYRNAFGLNVQEKSCSKVFLLVSQWQISWLLSKYTFPSKIKTNYH